MPSTGGFGICETVSGDGGPTPHFPLRPSPGWAAGACFISTQLLSTYCVPGPGWGQSCPHRKTVNQRLSQMNIKFNCEYWEGEVWGALRASNRAFAGQVPTG